MPRFGNFIGEAEDSDVESQHGASGRHAYDLDDDEEEEEEAEEAPTSDQQLMELDGDMTGSHGPMI